MRLSSPRAAGAPGAAASCRWDAAAPARCRISPGFICTKPTFELFNLLKQMRLPDGEKKCEIELMMPPPRDLSHASSSQRSKAQKRGMFNSSRPLRQTQKMAPVCLFSLDSLAKGGFRMTGICYINQHKGITRAQRDGSDAFVMFAAPEPQIRPPSSVRVHVRETQSSLV